MANDQHAQHLNISYPLRVGNGNASWDIARNVVNLTMAENTTAI